MGDNVEVNVYPLHQAKAMAERLGLYLVEIDKSLELCDSEIEGKISNRYKAINEHLFFPDVDEGEALIFNGFVYHGSVSHKYEKSRFSIDMRLQRFEKPLFQKFNEYFEVLKI